MSDMLNPKIIGQSKFCAAPFTSVYIGQFNEIRVCCASPTAIGNLSENKTLSEIINSNTAQDIRKHLSQNKFHSACGHCAGIEANIGKIANERYDNNKLGLPTVNDAVTNTDVNGYIHSQKPVWLDILYSNKCNFACMGCSADLSSTIATKYADAYNLIHGKPEDTPVIAEWQNDNDKIIDYILSHKDTIQLIHINGGEPFMQEPVHELLDVLLKKGLNKSIHIWSHTNGSISKYKSVDVIAQYLVNWGAKATITMSHDLHGEQGEYIRYGLKQKKWKNTYDRLQEANVDLNIQTCYNLFNALHMQELYDFYRYEINFDGHMVLGQWSEPVIYSARMMQLNPDLFSQANNVLDNMKYKKGDFTWLYKMHSIKQFLNYTIPEENIAIYKKRFLESIAKLDKLRETSFAKTFPELQSLI